MSRITLARWPALIGAIAVVAMGAPLADAAKVPNVKLRAPKSVKVNKHFTVKAKGKTAETETLRVFFETHGKCEKTAGGEEADGSFFAIKKDVGPGKFRAKRKGLYASHPAKGRFCAYLNKPADPPDTPPDARASRKIKIHR